MIETGNGINTKVAKEAACAPIKSDPKKKEYPFFYGRKCNRPGCKVTDKEGGQMVIGEAKFRGLPVVTLYCTGCQPKDRLKRPITYSQTVMSL